MKLTTYQHQSNISIGKVEGDQVIDLPRNDPALPATTRGEDRARRRHGALALDSELEEQPERT